MRIACWIARERRKEGQEDPGTLKQPAGLFYLSAVCLGLPGLLGNQAILILKPAAQGPGDGARGAIAGRGVGGGGAEPPHPLSPKVGTLRSQGPKGALAKKGILRVV